MPGHSLPTALRCPLTTLTRPSTGEPEQGEPQVAVPDASALVETEPTTKGRQPWWRQFRWWFPIAVYLATRLFTVVVVLVAQRSQIALPAPNGILRIMFPTTAAPGYWTVMGNWDGQWYQQIATQGYPDPLPLDDQGDVDMNAWAFFPLFPLIVGAVMKVTGIGFYVAGSLVATLIGAAAVILLFRLVDGAVGRWEAVVAVVGVSTFISAPVLQMTYTESLALLLVVLNLVLIRARHYWWVALTLVLLALTRNVVVAMAPVLVAHGVVRWWNERDAFPMRQRWLLGGLTAMSVALAGLWPVTIGLLTGVPDGYAQTMQAWEIGTDLKLASWWNYLIFVYGSAGPYLGVAILVVFAWFMLSHRSWRWGPELWGWAGAYPAYQILVTNTGPSRLRYALLAFPFTMFIAWFLRLRWWRRWDVWGLALVAVLGLVQQVWWIQNFVVVSHLDGAIFFP